MRRLLIHTIALACLMAGVSLTPAQAAWFPGDPIDDASVLGGLDLARDGTGAVVYIKSDGGVDHAFASRFIRGTFQPPQRLDGTFAGPSSQPVVAASDGGRLIAAFTNGGVVHAVLAIKGQPFSGSTALEAGSSPSVALSVNGSGLASFTSATGDVRIARLDRRTSQWSVLPQPVDIAPANIAGAGTGRSKIAVSADGVGIVTWGEAGHVWARKIFGAGISTAPQDLTPPSFGGRVLTVSDLPQVDTEDDSSYAQIVFRQQFADGGARVLARRQRGTTFDAPVVVDPGDEPVTDPRIALTSRGIGLVALAGTISQQPLAAFIDRRDTFGPTSRLFSPSAAGTQVAPAISETHDGIVAAAIGGLGQAAAISVRPFVEGVAQPDITLSRPELGGVGVGLGLEAAADRADGEVVAWIQGGKLVAGYNDREPGAFVGLTHRSCCVAARAALQWQRSFDVWGPMRYEVFVDQQSVGVVTDQTRLTLAKPLRGTRHSWHVVGSDARGQSKVTPTRALVVDDVLPRQTVHVARKGRRVTVRARGHDVRRSGHRTSGMGAIVVSWGDRTRDARGATAVRAAHRYRHAGTFALTVTSRDRAGNLRVRAITVRVR